MFSRIASSGTSSSPSSLHSASNSCTDFRPGCHDCLRANCVVPSGLGDRESPDSLGVALASVCGETLMPLCMNGFVGEGDRESPDIFGELCRVRFGAEGAVNPLLNPLPCGKLSDWSRKTPLTCPRNVGNRFSFALSGGETIFPLASIVAPDRGGGLLSVGRLSGLRLRSSMLSRPSMDKFSNRAAFSPSSSEESLCPELSELFE